MRWTMGLLLSIATFACNTTPPAPPPATTSPPPVPSPSASALAATGSLHLGEPISAAEVSLADVAKNPSKYGDHPFSTQGTVTAVCQEMGCWMEIKDAESGAHIRMHGHRFFVPKTASGHQAKVQATVVASKDHNTCADKGECAPENMPSLQLDATGVELM